MGGLGLLADLGLSAAAEVFSAVGWPFVDGVDSVFFAGLGPCEALDLGV
jgi:hypothetical protein